MHCTSNKTQYGICTGRLRFYLIFNCTKKVLRNSKTHITLRETCFQFQFREPDQQDQLHEKEIRSNYVSHGALGCLAGHFWFYALLIGSFFEKYTGPLLLTRISEHFRWID